jgi:hypothetical protein
MLTVLVLCRVLLPFVAFCHKFKYFLAIAFYIVVLQVMLLSHSQAPRLAFAAFLSLVPISSHCSFLF